MLIGSIVQLSNTNLFIFTPAFLDILQSGYKQARTLWQQPPVRPYIYIGGTHRYSAHPSVLLKWLWLTQPPSP